MEIRLIQSNKKQFLDLLLLADEQEDMIDRYLDRGDVHALFDDDLRAICVVTDEGGGAFELKNIATVPAFQGQGYGTALIRHVLMTYGDRGSVLYVGTGDNPRILAFYGHCGFVPSHRHANFFIDNYDHPIFEDGVQLVDMVYLKQPLKPGRESGAP